MCYWEEKISEQIETILLVFLSILFDKLLLVSPWTISMGHFRIVFMEAQQHHGTSPLLIKKGLFLHCLYCCALLWRRLVLHPAQVPGQAGSQACSVQHPPPICWAAAKTRIFLSQHKQTCSMGALLDISCQASCYCYIAIRTSGSATDQTDRLLYN